jgi:hypothetical protein
MNLTILFDDPYWVGILEVERDGQLFVGKHIFGAEPSDQLVYAFVQHHLLTLMSRMTVGLPIEESTPKHRTNPKRVQREISREMDARGITTRSQEAMRLQIEAGKQIRHEDSKEQREALRLHKRAVAQTKAKAKHRGH